MRSGFSGRTASTRLCISATLRTVGACASGSSTRRFSTRCSAKRTRLKRSSLSATTNLWATRGIARAFTARTMSGEKTRFVRMSPATTSECGASRMQRISTKRSRAITSSADIGMKTNTSTRGKSRLRTTSAPMPTCARSRGRSRSSSFRTDGTTFSSARRSRTSRTPSLSWATGTSRTPTGNPSTSTGIHSADSFRTSR